MKRIFALLLAVVLVFSLTACGKDNTTNDNTNTKTKKSETVDISKMSEDELTEIAKTNAVEYVKQKYPELTHSNVTVDNGINEDYVLEEDKYIKYYYNDKTFEENGIHQKTYEVCVCLSDGGLIRVMTDVSKKGTAGINSCYDDYQCEDILTAIFCKASNRKISDIESVDDVFNVGTDRFNIKFFHTFYDSTKDIIEFLKTAEEFKDKNKYSLVNIGVGDIDNLTSEQQELYSYFTEIYDYSEKRDYEYPKNSLTYDYNRVYSNGTVGFYQTFAPYLNGIEKVWKYDATAGKFIEVPHIIIKSDDNSSTINEGFYEYIATGGKTEKYDAVIGGNISEHIDEIKGLANEYVTFSDISLISNFHIAKEGYYYYLGLKHIPTEPNRKTGLVIVKDGEYTLKYLGVQPDFYESCLIDYDAAYINPLDLTDGCTFFMISFKQNKK